MTGSDWLDTQTKALLHKEPPGKLAPPDVDGYTLVLLQRGEDRDRVEHTLRALTDEALAAVSHCPLIVRCNLSLTDALVAQFELICADSISVILRDEVVRCAEPSYLQNLYRDLLMGDEFSLVSVRLKSVPHDEKGKQFLRQFFGQFLGVGETHSVARKKARVMSYWAAKMGVSIECDFPPI